MTDTSQGPVPEDVLEKIRKLLRLAGSDNPNEAALAMGRAQALMARHQIESVDLEVDLPEVGDHADVLDYSGGKLYAWRADLANALAQANRCRLIIRSTWAGEVGPKGNMVYRKRMVLVGTRNDAAAVGYLFALCSRELEELVKRHAQGRGKAYVNSFRRGVVAAITQAVLAERDRTRAWAQGSGHGAALARLDALGAAVEARLGSLKQQETPANPSDILAMAEGFRAGQSINVARTDPEARGLPQPSERLEGK